MKQFNHVEAQLNLHFGVDCLKMLSRELGRSSLRKAVIVCGSTVGRPGSNHLNLMQEALGTDCAGIFNRVQAHSPIPSVLEAADYLRSRHADAVVAVGGGSAIVTARAATIVLAEGSDISALCSQRSPDGVYRSPKLLAPKLPIFVVPTTPTTASLKAGTAVFDTVREQRLAMFDPKTRAKGVFVHPALIATTPKDLSLSASLNSLTMAVEGLESDTNDPFADAQLMYAVQQYVGLLPALVSGANEDTTARLMMAALMVGRATDFTGGGLASVLGHAIGARFHMDNGIANAIVLPHTIQFNTTATLERIGQIGTALGIGGTAGAKGCSSVLSDLFSRLRVPGRLRDVGIDRQALDSIADAAMHDWFVTRNPRPIQSKDQLLDVLESAY